MGVPGQAKAGEEILASCEFGNPPREYVLGNDEEKGAVRAAVFDVAMYVHCISQRKPDETDEGDVADPSSTPRAATTLDELLFMVVNAMLMSVDSLDHLKLFFCVDDYSGDDVAKMATLRARASAHAKVGVAPFDDASHEAFYLPRDPREWYNALFATRQHKYAVYCRLHEIIYAAMGDRAWCVVTGTDTCFLQRRISTMGALQLSTHPWNPNVLWGGDPTNASVLVPFDELYLRQINGVEFDPERVPTLPTWMRVSVTRVHRNTRNAIDAAMCVGDYRVADPFLAISAEFSNGDTRVWYTPLSLAGSMLKPLELWLNDTTLLVLTVQGIALPEDENTLDEHPTSFTVNMAEAALYTCGKAVKPRKTATEADHSAMDLACVLAKNMIPAVYCFRDSDWLVNLVHVLHTAHEVTGSVPPTFVMIRDQFYELTALFDPGNEAKLAAMRKLVLYAIALGNDYHGGIAGAGVKALKDALETWPAHRLPVVPVRGGVPGEQEVSIENIMRFAETVSKKQYISSKGITKDTPLPELMELFKVGPQHMVDSVALLRKLSRKRARTAEN